MSRFTTPNLALGVWDDGDNPGAGSKTVSNTGLNGNMLIIDTAVGTEHNADGTHKDDKIAGRSLKASIVDGATLEASAATGTKVFRVKDGGLTGVKMDQAAGQTVDGATLEFDSNAIRVKDGGISTAKLADDAVAAAKISHDNTRTKNNYTLVFDAKTLGTYAKYHGTAMTAALGIPMPRSGVVTKLTASHAGGGTASFSNAYGSGGLGTFAAGDRINGIITSGGSYNYPAINNITGAISFNAGFENIFDATGWTAAIFIDIEVEFDD